MKSFVLFAIFTTAFANPALASACIEGKYQISLGSGFHARFEFRFVEAADGTSAQFTSRGLNGSELIAFADGIAPVRKVYPDLNETLSRLKSPGEIFENKNRTLRAYFDGKGFQLAKAGDITPRPWSVTEAATCK